MRRLFLLLCLAALAAPADAQRQQPARGLTAQIDGFCSGDATCIAAVRERLRAHCADDRDCSREALSHARGLRTGQATASLSAATQRVVQDLASFAPEPVGPGGRGNAPRVRDGDASGVSPTSGGSASGGMSEAAREAMAGLPRHTRRQLRERCGDDPACLQQAIEDIQARREAGNAEARRDRPQGETVGRQGGTVGRQGTPPSLGDAVQPHTQPRRRPSPTGDTNLLWDPYAHQVDPATDGAWGGRERFTTYAMVERMAASPEAGTPYALRITGTFSGRIAYADEIFDARGIDVTTTPVTFRALIKGASGENYRIRIRWYDADGNALGFAFGGQVTADGTVQALEAVALQAPPETTSFEAMVESQSTPSMFEIFLLQAQAAGIAAGMDVPYADDPGCATAGYPSSCRGPLFGAVDPEDLPNNDLPDIPNDPRTDPSDLPGAGLPDYTPPGQTDDEPVARPNPTYRHSGVHPLNLSGSRGTEVRTLVADDGEWVYGIEFAERSDEPCYLELYVTRTSPGPTFSECGSSGPTRSSDRAVGFNYGGAASGWSSDESKKLNPCLGYENTHYGEYFSNATTPCLEWPGEPDLEPEEETLIALDGLAVCQRDSNNKLKGIKVRGDHVLPTSTGLEAETITWGSYYEVMPLSVLGLDLEDRKFETSERPHCNDWRDVRWCPAGEAMVGVDVHYEWQTNSRASITGLAPYCAAIVAN